MQVSRLVLKSAIGGVFLTLCMNAAFASSFQVWQQSAKSVGDDAAGAAAIADDASSIFYNPASSIRTKHQDLAVSLLGITPDLRFKGQQVITPAVSGFTPDSGTQQGGKFNVLPSLFYVAPVGDKWGFGFSYSTPYFMNWDYGRSSFTRYTLTENQLMTHDINISMAYRLLKTFSLGFGVSCQQIRFYDERMIAGSAVSQESLSETNLSHWGWGFNVGALWEMTPKTRFGLSYRSRILHHAVGVSKLNGAKQRTVSRVILPPVVILSGFHAFNDHWSVMGTASYTQWSQMGTFEIQDILGSSGPIVLAQKLKNTWQVAAGVHYHFNDKLVVRTGLGFDESPVRKKAYETILFPEANRVTLGVGMGYQFMPSLSFDVGYSHSFYARASVDSSNPSGSRSVQSEGQLVRSDDIIGLQFNWKMT